MSSSSACGQGWPVFPLPKLFWCLAIVHRLKIVLLLGPSLSFAGVSSADGYKKLLLAFQKRSSWSYLRRCASKLRAPPVLIKYSQKFCRS